MKGMLGFEQQKTLERSGSGKVENGFRKYELVILFLFLLQFLLVRERHLEHLQAKPEGSGRG